MCVFYKALQRNKLFDFYESACRAIDAPEGPTATLVIYRPHYIFGANAPVVITLDGIDIALLKNNNYLETPLRVGSHVISARRFRIGRANEVADHVFQLL